MLLFFLLIYSKNYVKRGVVSILLKFHFDSGDDNVCEFYFKWEKNILLMPTIRFLLFNYTNLLFSSFIFYIWDELRILFRYKRTCGSKKIKCHRQYIWQMVVTTISRKIIIRKLITHLDAKSPTFRKQCI